LEKVDVLTFEIELVNLDALLKLEAEGLKFILHLRRYN
jgi:phosphoribosylaminoimidazole carboxylase (NCAIR synthetase)